MMVAEIDGHTVSATEMVSLRDLRREVTSSRMSWREEGGNCDIVLKSFGWKDLERTLGDSRRASSANGRDWVSNKVINGGRELLLRDLA